jgi:hypothetical protein
MRRLTLFCVSVLLYSQENRGTIVGRVTDPSGLIWKSATGKARWGMETSA